MASGVRSGREVSGGHVRVFSVATDSYTACNVNNAVVTIPHTHRTIHRRSISACGVGRAMAICRARARARAPAPGPGRFWSSASVNVTVEAEPRLHEFRCDMLGRGIPMAPIGSLAYGYNEYMHA